MLKGLLISGGLVLGWIVVQGMVLHVSAPRKAFGSMVGWFTPTIPIFVVLYWVAPADLGVLPARFVGIDWRIGLANGLLVHGLLFLTAGLFYSHADRSITVRLLIELARAPQRRMTLAEMRAVCGVEVLMQDRLDIMIQNRFLEVRGERLVLTTKGWIAGGVGLMARRLLRIKAL